MRSQYFSHVSDADLAEYLADRDDDELTTWRPQSVASSDFPEYEATATRRVAPDYPTRRSPVLPLRDSSAGGLVPRRPPSARMFHSAGPVPQTPISLDLRSQVSHSTHSSSKSSGSQTKLLADRDKAVALSLPDVNEIAELRKRLRYLMMLTVVAGLVLAVGVVYTLTVTAGGKLTVGTDGVVNLNGVVAVQTAGESANLAVMGTASAPSASIRIGSQPSGVQSIDFGNYDANGFSPGVSLVAKNDSITLNAAQMVLPGELLLGTCAPCHRSVPLCRRDVCECLCVCVPGWERNN